MARNASGTHSLPAGNPVVTATTITSTWANDTLNDLSAEITDSLSRSGKGPMQAPLENVDGTVSAPAVTFDSETNTGLYRAGAADVRLTIAGTDRAKATATSWFYDMVTALTATSLSLKGAIADGASAVGVIIDNTIALATSGAKLVSFRSNGAEKAAIDKDGQVFAANMYAVASATSATLRGSDADDASAVGIILDNNVTLTNSAGKLVSVRNNTSEKAYFNKDGALYAAATESGTITAGTGWTASISSLRRGAGFVHVAFKAAADGTATTAVATLPANFRPLVALNAVYGVWNDNSLGLNYPAVLDISAAGAVVFNNYDNGSTIVTTPPIANLDTIEFSITFAAA